MQKNIFMGMFLSVLLLSLATTQYAFADGNGSPDDCNDGPTDEWVDSDDTIIYGAMGDIITDICIKSGTNSFGNSQHSGLISTDGTYGDGAEPNSCYFVMGLGSQGVKIMELGNEGCKDISHIDFVIDTNGGVPPGQIEIIGGEIIPIEVTSLLLAGIQVNLAWIVPVGLAGAGLVVYKLRRI